MKKTLLLMVSLLMGVNGTWATVTATISGMNQVGDYYYPIYTLSESSSISSFTSSNGSAPAVITDGTTLTFSHRGTVTLSGGETIEGKKYSQTIYDFTEKKGSKLNDGGNIWGFTSTTYYRYQQSSISTSGNTSIYEGIRVASTAGNSYLVYYMDDTKSTNGHGMQVSTNSVTITITSGATIACLDYYYNSAGPQIPTEDLTLATYAQRTWNTSATPSFTLQTRDDYYLYESLTTYTEVVPTLSNITVTFKGFEKTESYYYPKYEIKAVHDEDGTIEPSITAGANYTVDGNTLIYTTITGTTKNVNISYSTANSTATVPASRKYSKTTYDLTYTPTLSTHDNDDNALPTICGNSTSDSKVTRYYYTTSAGALTITSYPVGITFNIKKAATKSLYYYPTYGVQADANMATIKATNATAESYTIITAKYNTGDNTKSYASCPSRTYIIYGAEEGHSIGDKNAADTREIITTVDLYTPVAATLTATATQTTNYEKSGNYYYPTYSVAALLESTIDAEIASINVTSGCADTDGHIVKATGTEAIEIEVNALTGESCTVNIAAPTKYVLTQNFNFANIATYATTEDDKNGDVTGFSTGTVVRKKGLTIKGLTLGSVLYRWMYNTGYGLNCSNDSKPTTITALNTITGQKIELSYKVGESGNTAVWNETETQTTETTASSSSTTMTAYDKDGFYYCYTDLLIFTPASSATQSVTVNSAVGGMSTLVSPYPMDFSGDDIKAYKATWNSSTNMVRFTRVNKVPANTPVLVRYKTATTATETVNFCNAEDADVVGDNILVAGTGAAVATTDGDYTNFILTTKGGDYGFYYANDKTVSATKAYLHIPTASFPAGARLTFVFDDEENGVTAIGSHADRNFVNKNGFYNLQGQRISAPRRGLYIRDGKKMLMK